MKSLNNYYTLISLTTLVITNTTVAQASPFLITNPEKNGQALFESAITTNSMLIQSFGRSKGNPLFKGTYDKGAWSFSLKGDYSGMALDLSFNGGSDEVNSGKFNSNGIIGDSTWFSAGIWNFKIIDPLTAQMFWDSQATITLPDGKEKNPGRHTQDKKFAKSEDKDFIYIADSGTIILTENGKEVGKETQISDWVIPKNGLQDGLCSIKVSLGQSRLEGKGNCSDDKGEITGSIKAVPEPLTILGAATAVGFGAFFKRKTSKSKV